jgi:hypothetical protein
LEIDAGARRAAEELGVEMSWQGPLNDDDRAQQISMVEQFDSAEIGTGRKKRKLAQKNLMIDTEFCLVMNRAEFK